MSDQLPARRHSDLDDIARIGQWLAYSEDPHAQHHAAASAALRIYYARELGLPALAASELSVISGKLVVGAILMRALARRAGYRVRRLTPPNDPACCTCDIIERATGELLGDCTFTIEDAHQAGLIRERSAWKTHPARMLWARASANVIRDFAPEVAVGLVLDDEVQEIVPAAAPASDIPTDDNDAWIADQLAIDDALDDAEGVDTEDIPY